MGNFDRVSGLTSGSAFHYPLTPRELDVLRLLARGWTNIQIARELCITVDTVKFHTRNIYRKLEVTSRTEATLVAIRQGV